MKHVNQNVPAHKAPPKSYSMSLVKTKPTNSNNNTCLCYKTSQRRVLSFVSRGAVKGVVDSHATTTCIITASTLNTGRVNAYQKLDTLNIYVKIIRSLRVWKREVFSGNIFSIDDVLCASSFEPHSSSPLTVLLGSALIDVLDRSSSWPVVRALYHK